MSEFVDHIRSSILEDATIHTPYTYRVMEMGAQSKTEREGARPGADAGDDGLCPSDGGRASLHHERQSDFADLHRFAHNVRIENVLTQTVREN